MSLRVASWYEGGDQRAPLGVGESKALGTEPSAQDAVLGAQILDGGVLPALLAGRGAGGLDGGEPHQGVDEIVNCSSS